MSKKIFAIILVLILTITTFAACGETETPETPTPESSTPVESSDDPETPEETTLTGSLTVAALESAYGAEMWQEIVKAFNEIYPDVSVELIIDKEIESAIDPGMKAGDYPDVVHLAVGRPAALTETLIKEKMLLDITDVFDMAIPGEDKTPNDKLIPGFTDTLITNPYQDGKTHLAPMFYGPTGLFFNATLFTEKGWEVPTTWDEMWELGDKAKAEGIALFTYPTTGYFDAFFYALATESGGADFFNKVMTYEEGIFNTPEATAVFDIITKLAEYTEPSTPSNANNENYLKNQQLVLDNKALFMPNGTWVTGEMADAPKADGFEWGFTALPAIVEGGDRYSYTFFEQAWIPSEAENIDNAKHFVAFLYSDTAAKIFADKAAALGAIQPIAGMSASLEGEGKLFYSIYDTGAKAAMGNFATTNPVEGVSIADTLFGSIDSLVSGDKTKQEWIDEVVKVSDALRAAMG